MKMQNSQTKQTAKLARKIRKLRERKKNPLSWKHACQELNILKENGDPDTGMAYKIAYEEYEPSGRDVRQRLNLRDICTKCKRVFRVPKPARVREKSPARLWFNKLNTSDQEKVIEFAYRNYLNWSQRREEKNVS